jgi:hypothetical protein
LRATKKPALEAHFHGKDDDQPDQAGEGRGKGNAHAQNDQDKQHARHRETNFKRVVI